MRIGATRIVAAALVVTALCPSVALAYEDMGTAGAGVGAAFTLDPETPSPCCGVMLAAAGTVGLGDTFSLGAQLAGVVHPGSESPTRWLGFFALEVTYLLDVVTVVPFFGVGLDAVIGGAEGSFGLDFGAHAVLGAEYLVDRNLVVGLDLRPRFLFLRAADDLGLGLFYLTASARVSYRFDL